MRNEDPGENTEGGEGKRAKVKEGILAKVVVCKRFLLQFMSFSLWVLLVNELKVVLKALEP